MGVRGIGRGEPGPVTIVGVSVAAIATGTFISVSLGVLAPELRDAFGFSRAEIGVLTALYAIGGALSSPFTGGLTDRIGPARVLSLSLLAMAGATLLGAVAPVGAVLMLAAFLAGAGYGGINPPTNVIVAGRLGERLGFFLSLKQTGVPIGGFVAGLLLPAVAVSAGWRWAFAVGAVGTALAACAALLVRGAATLGQGAAARGLDAGSAVALAAGEAAAPAAPATALPAPPHRDRGHARRDRVAIIVFGFLLAGCQWVMVAYLVLSLHDGRGWGLGESGAALSAVTAVSVAGRLVWGWASDRLGSRVPTLLALAGTSAVGLAVLAVEPPRVVVYLVAALLGGSLAAWNGVYHALVVERAGPGALGKESGRNIAFLFAGSVCVPPLLGLLSQATDSWTVLWAADALLVVVAALVLRFGLTPMPADPPGADPPSAGPSAAAAVE